MKHTLGILISVIGVLILAMYLVYPLFPKNIDVNAAGIKYRLGDPSIEKPVRVQLNGKIHTTFLGKKTFKGEIEIEGEVNQFSKEAKYEVGMPPRDYTMGSIVHFYVDEDEAGDTIPGIFQYGGLYQKKDFEQGAVVVFDQDEEGDADGWSSEDGYMIAYPAGSREEALTISMDTMYHPSLLDPSDPIFK
ncbi:hypothetical protein M3231_10520 [Neobacillus mesonae]|nr:hypothetical protein [Neobacillus mesonae]